MGERPEQQTPENLERADLRVAVGIPSRGEWTADTALSVINMARHFERAKAGELNIIAMGGFVVPEQRSRIWAEAAKWDATHLLFVDSDMGFPEDALARLLAHQKDIVGVNYPRKSYPFWPTAYEDTDDHTGVVFTTEDSAGLHEVKHCGFGLILIDMRVFDVLVENNPAGHDGYTPPPFFHFAPTKDGTKWSTEDVYFCRRARSLGFKVHIDHDLSKQIRHVGQWTYDNFQSVATDKAIKEQLVAGVVPRMENSRRISPVGLAEAPELEAPAHPPEAPESLLQDIARELDGIDVLLEKSSPPHPQACAG
jgi:hypothetical protein